MDGSIKIVMIGDSPVWELDLLPPISPLVPQDVDADGEFDHGIPIFDAPHTVAARKKAA